MTDREYFINSIKDTYEAGANGGDEMKYYLSFISNENEETDIEQMKGGHLFPDEDDYIIDYNDYKIFKIKDEDKFREEIDSIDFIAELNLLGTINARIFILSHLKYCKDDNIITRLKYILGAINRAIKNKLADYMARLN